MNKNKITILVSFFSLCTLSCIVFWLLFHKTAVISGNTIAGNWHSEYSVYSGNFLYFNLKPLQDTDLQVECVEDLVIDNDGMFRQIIICPHNSIDLTTSGKWIIQTINQQEVIKLSNMKYLFPDVNIKELLYSGNPLFESRLISVIEPERDFLDTGLSKDITYLYSDNGFVLLFARVGVNNKIILVHGITIDEKPVEYSK